MNSADDWSYDPRKTYRCQNQISPFSNQAGTRQRVHLKFHFSIFALEKNNCSLPRGIKDLVAAFYLCIRLGITECAE